LFKNITDLKNKVEFTDFNKIYSTYYTNNGGGLNLNTNLLRIIKNLDNTISKFDKSLLKELSKIAND